MSPLLRSGDLSTVELEDARALAAGLRDDPPAHGGPHSLVLEQAVDRVPCGQVAPLEVLR